MVKADHKILLCLAHMSGNEMKFIQEAFDTNWVVPLGPNVNKFEEGLKDYLSDSSKCVAALCSGTAALHLALVNLGIGRGDEVICQSFTFAASANPIVYQGATPVFVDSEIDSWNLDPDLLEKAIEVRIRITGHRPKAVIAVDLYGMPARIDKIVAVCQKYGIPLIEDAAEALGSRFNGRLCGTFGSFGALSFNGNKMITTSGGGALICPDEESKRRTVFYATQARESFPYYQHERIGFNYRLSNICAGIGMGQLTVLDKHIAWHKHVASRYKDAFKSIDGITFHDNPWDKADCNFWLSTILIAPDLHVKGQEDVYGKIYTDCQPNANVEALRIYLDKANIETRPLWKPMHKQPVYKDAPQYVNGVSECVFHRGLCLPSGPMVTDDDVTYIIKKIKEAIK